MLPTNYLICCHPRTLVTETPVSTSCFYSSVIRPNAFFHPVLHTCPPLILPGALVPLLGLSCFPHSCVQPLTRGLREAQVSCEHNPSENYRFAVNVRAFLFCRFSVVTQLCVGDDLVLSRRQQAGHSASVFSFAFRFWRPFGRGDGMCAPLSPPVWASCCYCVVVECLARPRHTLVELSAQFSVTMETQPVLGVPGSGRRQDKARRLRPRR